MTLPFALLPSSGEPRLCRARSSAPREASSPAVSGLSQSCDPGTPAKGGSGALPSGGAAVGEALWRARVFPNKKDTHRRRQSSPPPMSTHTHTNHTHTCTHEDTIHKTRTTHRIQHTPHHSYDTLQTTHTYTQHMQHIYTCIRNTLYHPEHTQHTPYTTHTTHNTQYTCVTDYKHNTHTQNTHNTYTPVYTTHNTHHIDHTQHTPYTTHTTHTAHSEHTHHTIHNTYPHVHITHNTCHTDPTQHTYMYTQQHNIYHAGHDILGPSADMVYGTSLHVQQEEWRSAACSSWVDFAACVGRLRTWFCTPQGEGKVTFAKERSFHFFQSPFRKRFSSSDSTAPISLPFPRWCLCRVCSPSPQGHPRGPRWPLSNGCRSLCQHLLPMVHRPSSAGSGTAPCQPCPTSLSRGQV